MTSLRWTIPCLAAIALAAMSCSPKPDAAVKRDFAKYKAQMEKIAVLEDQGIAANKEATEQPNASDATYIKALREKIIPAFEAYAGEVAQIRPLTEPVLELQRIYLRRIAAVIAGFRDLEKSGSAGGKALVDRATSRFAEGKALLKVWQTKRDALEQQFK